MGTLIVVTTVATREQAQTLARAIVERRLAACAQIDAIDSLYHWQGQVQQEPEARISFKTTEAAHAALVRTLVELHPYELPAIHAVAPAAVHGPYERWISDNTEDSPPAR